MRNFRFRSVARTRVVPFDRIDLANPKAYFLLRNYDRIPLVVGAKHELGEKFDFTAILALRFDLAVVRRRKIIDFLRVLRLVRISRVSLV